jgi:ComF family protein
VLTPAPLLAPPPGLAVCAALLAYEGAGREIVARLKYRNARSVVAWLAGGMASLVADSPVHDPTASGPVVRPIDVVAWVPTTTARKRERGFDQGRLLAVAVARRLVLPCRGLLRRRPGPPQTGRSRLQRLNGPAFEVLARRPVPGHVLLVDDVVTTGATLAAAARCLREAGAAEVSAVAAGRTP